MKSSLVFYNFSSFYKPLLRWWFKIQKYLKCLFLACKRGYFVIFLCAEAVIFKTKLFTSINGDSSSADIQVECGDGSGPIKFMIQKAGSTDNTLGFNGWQSADHWFTANLDSQSNIEVGQLVWVKLEASIIKHLSFTNYRISAKRDNGKVCAGVLSGGVISDRPDGAKKIVAAVVAPTALVSVLPDLPEAFTKTHIDVIPDPEAVPDAPHKAPVEPFMGHSAPVISEPEKVISLPDLPAVAQPTQEAEVKASVIGTNTQEKKKTSPILFIAIGLGLLVAAIAGYFLTKGSSDPFKPNTPIQTPPPVEVKPSTPAPVTPPAPAPMSPVVPQPPKTPPGNGPRPTSPSPAAPDLNKIVKDAINK